MNDLFKINEIEKLHDLLCGFAFGEQNLIKSDEIKKKLVTHTKRNI